jgi:hypothetical protein
MGILTSTGSLRPLLNDGFLKAWIMLILTNVGGHFFKIF